jgi:hypothetical protein
LGIWMKKASWVNCSIKSWGTPLLRSTGYSDCTLYNGGFLPSKKMSVKKWAPFPFFIF